MIKKETFFVVAFFLLLILGFFNKTFLKGFVPFPGDLLISEYQPWRSSSFLGYTPGSFPNKAQYFDVIRQLYPWKTLVISSIKNHELPLWNPYNFSGTPLLANFQSAVFYPFNVFYLLFPQIMGWTILVILQPFLALVFTYFYARKIGLRVIGSLFAAVSFAFSSFMIVWLEYNTIGHVLLYLPLALLSVENILERFSLRWMVIFVLALLFSQFAGHPQIFFYSLVLVIAYLFYRTYSQKITVKRKYFTIFFPLLILTLGIGSILLLPGIELIKNAARSVHDYNFLIQKILIQPWQFVMFFVPDFFGNAATRNYWLPDTYIGKVTSIGHIPILFIFLALTQRKNSFIKFFIIAGVFTLLLATLNPLTIFLYKFNIPIISTSTPTLAIFLFCFAASMLCGLGVDFWEKESFKLTKFVRIIASIIFVYITLWIVVLLFPKITTFSWVSNLSISMRNLFYSTIIIIFGLALLFAGIKKSRLKFTILVLLLLVHVVDLNRSFEKFNPFSPPQTIFPKTEILSFLQENANTDRFWGYGSAFIEANITTQYSIFSPDGYDPLYPARYGEFIHSSKEGKILKEFSTTNRSDAVIAPGYGDDLPKNPYRLRVLDMLGVKYVLDRVENGASENIFTSDRFSPIYEKDGWKIFVNKKASPHAFLTNDYKVFNTKEEFENIFFANSFNPSKTILLEENVPEVLSNDQSSNVKLQLYTPNKVSYQTQAGSNKLLFLSDVYYPGWKAFIDGEETKIYRANYAFRAVLVPAGEHNVEFIYLPASFNIGKKISLGSIALFLVYLLILYKKRYQLYNK